MPQHVLWQHSPRRAGDHRENYRETVASSDRSRETMRTRGLGHTGSALARRKGGGLERAAANNLIPENLFTEKF